MLLTRAAIRNRTTVGGLVLMIVLAGLFSYFTLPREAAPDVPIPLILVETTYEGVSPEDVESSVTIKVEDKLTGLKDVKEMNSTSREGSSLIIVEFEPETRDDAGIPELLDLLVAIDADQGWRLYCSFDTPHQWNGQEFPACPFRPRTTQ